MLYAFILPLFDYLESLLQTPENLKYFETEEL